MEYMAFLRRLVVSGQEGQILLVVVLTMIVALTVGLSVAARVVTELKLSKQNEESQRAFQAAESGIQQALSNAGQTYTLNINDLGNKAAVNAVKTTDVDRVLILNNGQEVDQVTGSDVWLSDYSTDSSLIYLNPMGNGSPVTITLYWGKTSQTSCAQTAGDSTAPAIEVVVLKGPKANPTILKNVYDTASCGTTRISGAISANASPIPVPVNTPSSSSPRFQNHVSLTFNGSSLSDGLLMRVIPIFNSSIIGFSANVNFPAQGSIVTSTGTSGDTVRKVTYFQSYPQLPIEIFPYSQLSQ